MKKYPIEVIIFKKYGNSLKIVKDLGRVVSTWMDTEDGRKVKKEFFELKKHKIRFPPVDFSFYQEFGNKRVLYLLMPTRDIVLPLKYHEGELYAEVPVQKEENGLPQFDKEGNPIYELKKMKILDTRVALEDGRIISLPSLIPTATYDLKHWLTEELTIATKFYSLRKFWEKYGNLLLTIVGAFIMFLIVAYALTKFTQMSKDIASAFYSSSSALKEVAKQLAMIRNASVNATVPPY